MFPDTDPKWKGARSDIFLNEAVSVGHKMADTVNCCASGFCSLHVVPA
jgi:2C-methyl-D-erythritol 2,4-cyclodiphosphate synthase